MASTMDIGPNFLPTDGHFRHVISSLYSLWFGFYLILVMYYSVWLDCQCEVVIFTTWSTFFVYCFIFPSAHNYCLLWNLLCQFLPLLPVCIFKFNWLCATSFKWRKQLSWRRNYRFIWIWLRWENVRILNACEVRFENSITRVTVRHHEACREISKSCSDRRNFQFTPIDYGFFFSHVLPLTIAFKLLYVFL